jgi:hypothetical protein
MKAEEEKYRKALEEEEGTLGDEEAKATERQKAISALVDSGAGQVLMNGTVEAALGKEIKLELGGTADLAPSNP